MAKRKDIKSILVVGAGPIIIGQACEFDYSGTQACKALMEEGYRVILINSNPATIMTDPETADVVYIEPITPDVVKKIIIKDRAINAAGHPRVAMRIKSLLCNWPLAYTIELAGVPITSQYAIEVEIASPTPTRSGLVPELIAISSTTGPITATVAPALIRLVINAPITATKIANGSPSCMLKVVKIFIRLSANHLAAPLDLNTAPRLIAPAYNTITPQLTLSS